MLNFFPHDVVRNPFTWFTLYLMNDYLADGFIGFRMSLRNFFISLLSISYILTFCQQLNFNYFNLFILSCLHHKKSLESSLIASFPSLNSAFNCSLARRRCPRPDRSPATSGTRPARVVFQSLPAPTYLLDTCAALRGSLPKPPRSGQRRTML